MAHLTKDPAARERWVAIYPVYINSKKSIQEGRKLTKALAVDTPTALEIALACKSLGLNSLLEEHKRYSRDFTLAGRVRVQLFNSDHSPVNPAVATRTELYKQVAEAIAKTPERKAAAAAAANEQSSLAASSSAASKGGNSNKKNKKKR